MDRCVGAGRALAGRATVVGIELASRSDSYAWEESGVSSEFAKVTLFPSANADRLTVAARAWAVVRAVRRHRIGWLFISGYEQPANFIVALCVPLFGCRCYVMLDSKFDDKPRRLAREILKRLLMLPYRGGFASGPRSAAYLRFLGFRRRPVALGYDTVSMERLRPLGVPPSTWEERPFLAVARFVPKKNLSLALRAYRIFRDRAAGSVRRLRLCGGGALEAELRAEAAALGIAGNVDFLGFQPQAMVAAELSTALCLLLPSSEEQWGLVVNEALAFGLPVLASTNVGACDLLIRSWGNGFVLDPEEPEAWAAAMLALAQDRHLWEQFHRASRNRAEAGDVAAFAGGVEALIGAAIGVARIGA